MTILMFATVSDLFTDRLTLDELRHRCGSLAASSACAA